MVFAYITAVASATFAQTPPTTPKAYVIAEIMVKDAATFENYKGRIAPVVAQFGGRYLVRGGAAEAIEGTAPAGRVVVVEFDSLAAARAFEHSPEYKAVAALRHRAADSRVFIVEGTSP